MMTEGAAAFSRRQDISEEADALSRRQYISEEAADFSRRQYVKKRLPIPPDSAEVLPRRTVWA